MQWVKDPALSLLWLESRLRQGFDPWPGNVHMPHHGPKKKRERETERNLNIGERYFLTPDLYCLLINAQKGLFPQQPGMHLVSITDLREMSIESKLPTEVM